MNPPINEVGRHVIALPADKSFLHDTALVAVAVDAQADGARRFSLLGRHDLDAVQSHVMDELCRTRAKDCVRGGVRVQGCLIRPEKYLALWRQSVEAPLTLQQFSHLTGKAIRLAMSIDIAHEMRKPRQPAYADSPVQSVEHYVELYAGRAARTDGLVHIEVDLREPDAARRARHASMMFCIDYQDPDKHETWCYRSHMALRIVDDCTGEQSFQASQAVPMPVAQVDLFEALDA